MLNFIRFPEEDRYNQSFSRALGNVHVLPWCQNCESSGAHNLYLSKTSRISENILCSLIL